MKGKFKQIQSLKYSVTMLAKRIIPCLDIKNGRTVKGVHFMNLRDAGHPVELASYYAQSGADELLFLDIAATNENRSTLLSLVREVAAAINIPFTVGGGVRSIKDAASLLDNGADKISLNSSAIVNPVLIDEISKMYGNQCVVIAVDAAFILNEWKVFRNGGTIETDKELFDWVREAENRGAGEVLFTSMNHDGTKDGFALEALKTMVGRTKIPVIASGGAGKIEHFRDVFMRCDVSAALAASVFHYGEIAINELKNYLKQNQICVR